MAAFLFLIGFWMLFSVVATPIIGRFLTLREPPDDVATKDDAPTVTAHHAAH